MRADEGIETPRRATRGSCGYDFFAPEDIVLQRGKWTDIGTGVYLTDNDIVCFSGDFAHYVMLLVPRSGLGFKYGVRMANTCGVIDEDYRGEIRAKLTCDVDQVIIRKGERFMQGILLPFGKFAGEIRPTEDRTGGFGSTGE